MAGVSVGTVSNVLNGMPGVSDIKRDRVLEAIRQLNYNPNYAARALKTRRSHSIGLIIPDIGNPFYPEFARGVEDSACAAGYTLFLCNSDRSADKEKTYLHALVEKMVDGLILYKTHLSAEELIQYRRRCRIVLVDIGADKSLGCDIVNVDDYTGVRQALQLLWKYSHRRIAFIAGQPDSMSSRDRVRAFHDFYHNLNCPVPQNFVQYGYYDWHSGYVNANNLLKRLDPPTAILAANDLMAIGAIKAVQERGLSVPHDISVMGYDDIDMASLYMPALTTVRQPKYEMGQCSFRAMLQQLDKDRASKDITITTLQTEIIERASVDYCRESK